MNIKKLFWSIKLREDEDGEWFAPEERIDEDKVGNELDELLSTDLSQEAFDKAEVLIIRLLEIHEEYAFERGFKAAVGLLAGSLTSNEKLLTSLLKKEG